MLTTTIASVRERLRTLAGLSPQAGEAADAMADLDGRDATLVVVPEPEATPPPPPTSGGEARLTVRLPESLKNALGREADREGISVNALIVRTLAGATNRPPTATIIGSRLTGWARA